MNKENESAKEFIKGHKLDVIKTRDLPDVADGCYIIAPEKLEALIGDLLKNVEGSTTPLATLGELPVD